MQADINSLRQDIQQANKGVEAQRAKLAEQMKRAEQKIDEVSQALANLRRAARMTDADFGVQIERMIRETQELRGTLELTEYRLGKLEAKLDGEGSLTARVEALESGGSAGGTSSASSSPPPSEAPPKDKKQLLGYARKLAKAGKVAEARGVYRDVAKRWPDEAGVTDEAFFRLGELYYGEKKYRSALQEFIKVYEKFPKGRFVDDALFRIGVCSIDIGNLEDAQIFFNEIVKNHRKSPLVKHAKSKLDEVRKKLEAEKSKKGDRKGSRRK